MLSPAQDRVVGPDTNDGWMEKASNRSCFDPKLGTFDRERPSFLEMKLRTNEQFQILRPGLAT
jgi:hypothetical protein